MKAGTIASSPPCRESLTDIARDHNAQQLFLTANGNTLLTADSECLDAFLESARRLTDEPPVSGEYPYIGGGKFGQVYELPGFDALCMKVSRSGIVNLRSSASAPSLVTEARFMNAMQKRLEARPSYAVRAPKQYAVARFAGGAVLLEERIPRQFQSLQSIRDNGDGVAYKELLKQEKSILKRIQQSLGISALRLGAGDLRGTYGRLHHSNVLTDKPDNPMDGNLYVVDLMGAIRLRCMLASVVGHRR